MAQAERRLCIADQHAGDTPDERDAHRLVDPLPDILRARIFTIASGYDDTNDLGRLRLVPAGTLGIDDMVDIVHGHQRLSLNVHYYQRCFLPVHIYDMVQSVARG